MIAVKTNAGIVDQNVDLKAPAFGEVPELLAAAGQPQIDRCNRHSSAMGGLQLLGQGLQLASAAGHQHQGVAPGRQQAGELQANPGTSARD